jgi:hypothetical protein
MSARLGSLENDFRGNRNLHRFQQELIDYEQRLINQNNKRIYAKKVAPGKKNDTFPRIRRQYNKYDSKPPLTRAYVNGSPNPNLTSVRGRYNTQRQCLYVPKKSLMQMAKDMKIIPFKDARPSEFAKGTKLWKAYRTEDICNMMREKYISKRRTPIAGMTALDDPRLREVKKSLEFVAARIGVPTVLNLKSKSMLRLSKDVTEKLSKSK